MKVGNEVITKSPLWHNGVDVGDRLGVIVDMKGHVLVDIYEYDSNPVKCFRQDIEVLATTPQSRDERFLEIEQEVEDLFAGLLPTNKP